MGPSNAHISFLDGIIIVSFVRPVQEAVRVSLLRQRDGKGVVVQALDPTAVDFGESEFQLPSLLSPLVRVPVSEGEVDLTPLLPSKEIAVAQHLEVVVPHLVVR